MTATTIRRRAGWLLVVAALGLLAGCGETRIETTYGQVRGRSVNGTGVFAELLRGRGHEVRSARRLNDELAGWAGTIVRFAPQPGPIDREEADWYLDWQLSSPGRRLIYVCRDGVPEAEYWAEALASLPADAPKAKRERIEEKLVAAPGWGSELPPPGAEAADPETWFGFDEAQGLIASSKSLSGPWAEGVDPSAAELPINRALATTSETELPLLLGDDRILAMDWVWEDEGETEPSAVLVVANGSFLLNAAMVNKARRPLAVRAAEWAGEAPRNVAFVEGTFLLGEQSPMPTPWDVIRQVPELGMVAGHFLAMALVAALAKSVILGRPRPSPASGADRPRAHAEALGDLMSRVGGERAARALLASYRRWRRPMSHDERTDDAS